MPAIHRLEVHGSAVCVYPGDHAPPHFHVRGAGWDALIGIASLRVLRGRGPRPALEAAIAWARIPDNAYLLSEHWRRLNERE